MRHPNLGRTKKGCGSVIKNLQACNESFAKSCAQVISAVRRPETDQKNKGFYQL